MTKEEEEDLRKINIPEVEGNHKVEGPQTDNQDITPPLQTKQVNICIEEEPKFMKIGDYWENATMDKVVELFSEY